MKVTKSLCQDCVRSESKPSIPRGVAGSVFEQKVDFGKRFDVSSSTSRCSCVKYRVGFAFQQQPFFASPPLSIHC